MRIYAARFTLCYDDNSEDTIGFRGRTGLVHALAADVYTHYCAVGYRCELETWTERSPSQPKHEDVTTLHSDEEIPF